MKKGNSSATVVSLNAAQETQLLPQQPALGSTRHAAPHSHALKQNESKCPQLHPTLYSHKGQLQHRSGKTLPKSLLVVSHTELPQPRGQMSISARTEKPQQHQLHQFKHVEYTWTLNVAGLAGMPSPQKI